MEEKLLLTTYLASAIEKNKVVLTEKKENHKELIKKELDHPLVGIYDPVEREAQKTGKKSGEHVGYVIGLKKAGLWKNFLLEMQKIWWGKIITKGNKVEIMKILRNRFLVDGNKMHELNHWGDIEAVLRSNFIIVFLEKDVRTVGTIREIAYAELFDIPVYLILPNQTKTDANSSLLEMVLHSGGDIYYSTKDAIKAIKEHYPIGWK